MDKWRYGKSPNMVEKLVRSEVYGIIGFLTNGRINVSGCLWKERGLKEKYQMIFCLLTISANVIFKNDLLLKHRVHIIIGEERYNFLLFAVEMLKTFSGTEK